MTVYIVLATDVNDRTHVAGTYFSKQQAEELIERWCKTNTTYEYDIVEQGIIG